MIWLMGALSAWGGVDDPVAYWSFGDAASLLSNQVTSSPYHDATVLAGHPVSGLIGGAAGVVGNALMLDGASALRLPYHQDNLGQSFTIAMWYWQATNDTRMALYQSKDNWVASYEANATNASMFMSYVGQNAVGGLTTGLREWVHLVHVFSTSSGTTTLSVYTNGALALTGSVSASYMFDVMQLRAIHVGAHRTGDRFFKGMIDELALYNRALSAGEAQALYQRGCEGMPLPVTPGACPEIGLGGTQRSFMMSVDSEPAGVYQDGWLKDDIQTAPNALGLIDKAARQDDTAGNADGPFHAEALNPKYRVPITTALSQLTQGDFTLEARFSITNAGRGIVMGNFSNNVVNAVNLELHTDNRVRLYVQPSGGVPKCDLYASAGAINTRDGAWHHLAGLRRAGAFYLYLDGVELARSNDVAGAFSLGGPYFYLKGDSRSDATMFSGDIENARLWTRALTTNELASLSAGMLPGGPEVAPDGMLAEYAGLYGPYTAPYANPRYRTRLTPPLANMTRTNFTVETWFRTTNTNHRGILIGSYANSATISCVNLELRDNNTLRLYIQPSLPGQNLTDVSTASLSPANMYDGNWHHFVGLRRDGFDYIYFDGVQKGKWSDTAGAFSMTNNSYIYFGRDMRTGATEFNGDLKNVRLWNRALTAGEVASLAAGKVPGDPAVDVQGLLAAYDYIIPTNSLRSAGYCGSRFLRTCVAGSNTLSLVFDGLPPHTKIGVSALVAQLDSLDPVTDGDNLAVFADGAEVLKARLGPGTATAPALAALRLLGQTADTQLLADCLILGGENLFYCGGETVDHNEHVYDLSRLDALRQISHTGSTLTLNFVGVQNQDGGDEGFGIDRIGLTVIPLKGTLIMVH